jgi:hypothetical protein
MALPSKKEIEDLVSSLSEIAKGYADTPDLNGYITRVQIIAKAKELTRALITPDQAPNYHGLNVRCLIFSTTIARVTHNTPITQIAELVAIRTFMKLKVLDAIPKEGSISLEDLSKATGAQDSLLGTCSRAIIDQLCKRSPLTQLDRADGTSAWYATQSTGNRVSYGLTLGDYSCVGIPRPDSP